VVHFLLAFVRAAAPKSRLKYLQTPATPWQQLMVYEVGQQGAMSGPYICSSNGGSSGNDSDSSVVSSNQGSQAAAAEGSGDDQHQAQLQEALKLPLMGYSHMVYVCYKI